MNILCRPVWALPPMARRRRIRVEVLKGCILPFGGYKGASIALMIELLVGPLIGEASSVEAAKRHGGVMIRYKAASLSSPSIQRSSKTPTAGRTTRNPCSKACSPSTEPACQVPADSRTEKTLLQSGVDVNDGLMEQLNKLLDI